MNKKKLRNLYSVLLTCVLLTVCMYPTAVAEEVPDYDTEVVSAELATITSDISEAIPLNESKVKSLAAYQIDTYLPTEIGENSQNVYPAESGDWIPLHDLEGNCFAYLIPLVEKGVGEIGYITVSAIEDGFTNYEMNLSLSLLNTLRESLVNNEEAVAIFLPPMDYALQIENGEGRKICRIDPENYELIDITAQIAENSDDLTNRYKLVRSDENAVKTEAVLDEAQKFESGISTVATRSAVEDVRLSCEYEGENKFVPISYDGKTWYGGKQGWFTTSTHRERGCGVVAACNILYYMSTKSSTYKKLYPYTSLSYSNFTGFMNSMYSHMNPAPWGSSSRDQWINQVKSWASNRGVTLSAAYYSAANTKANCATLIKNGLKADKPVAALNLAKLTGYEFEWHWVTITKYYQSSNDNRWIAISTWGERRSIDWDTFWQYAHDAILVGGYAYFK